MTPMKHLPSLVVAVGCALLLSAGCKKGPAGPPAAPADVSAADKTVNVLIFSEYVPQDVLDDFKKESGIEAKVGTIASNEELLGKLRGNAADVDVVSASDYMVRRLNQLGLARRLDPSALPNLKNIDPDMLGRPYDQANEVSVPLFWGTVGIGYNKKKLTGPVDSWAVMFDASRQVKVLMLNDPRELLAAALRTQGKDPNTRDPAAITAAADALKAQHKQVNPLYDTEGFAEKLLAGDVALAQGFNGQFAKVIAQKPDELAFVVPKEGGTLWIDNLVVPTSAKRGANAYKFIDYLMRPDVAVRTANYAAYATPNAAAKPNVKKELLDNPTIYPPADVLKRCATMEDLGESNKLADRVMTEIKQ